MWTTLIGGLIALFFCAWIGVAIDPDPDPDDHYVFPILLAATTLGLTLGYLVGAV